MNNKVAFITGAARRIGAEIARDLHRAGMNVVIHYRSSVQDAAQLCEQLNEEREDSAHLVQAELSDIENYSSLIEQVVARWGRLDILVNNASSFYPTPLKTITIEQWQDLFSSNLQAPLFLAQHSEPHLSKSEGCIINIADIHAFQPLKNHSIYCMSKAGLVMLTKALAQEMGPRIRVNAVAPGAVLWPEADNVLTDAQKQQIIEQTAVKRHGEPGNIAQTVLFFIQNHYVTGQVMAVDGGRYLA